MGNRPRPQLAFYPDCQQEYPGCRQGHPEVTVLLILGRPITTVAVVQVGQSGDGGSEPGVGTQGPAEVGLRRAQVTALAGAGPQVGHGDPGCDIAWVGQGLSIPQPGRRESAAKGSCPRRW